MKYDFILNIVLEFWNKSPDKIQTTPVCYDVDVLYSHRLTGPYFAGAPGGCWPRNSYRLDRPIVPAAHPRCTRRVDDLEGLPVDKAAVSKTLLPLPASHRDAPGSSSTGRPRSHVCELRFYIISFL